MHDVVPSAVSAAVITSGVTTSVTRGSAIAAWRVAVGLLLASQFAVQLGAQLGALLHGRSLVQRLLALVGQERHAHAGHVLLCTVVLGVSHTLRGQYGVERSDAVQLHLVAVGQHLLDASLQLG